MRSSSRIALWVILIVLFVVFYNFFAVVDPGAHPRGTSTSGMSGFGLVPLLVFVALFAFFMVRNRRTAVLNGEGLALSEMGRHSEALEKFIEVRRVLPRNPLFAYNVGWSQLSLWRLREAAEEFERVTASRMIELKKLALPTLALATALRGQSETARRWLEEARTQGNDASPTGLLASAVLACRAGQWPEARALLQRKELRQLGGVPRGVSDALRAWSALQLDGRRIPVDRVAVFGEAGPGLLQQDWPEFAAFLDSAPPG